MINYHKLQCKNPLMTILSNYFQHLLQCDNVLLFYVLTSLSSVLVHLLFICREKRTNYLNTVNTGSNVHHCKRWYACTAFPHYSMSSSRFLKMSLKIQLGWEWTSQGSTDYSVDWLFLLPGTYNWGGWICLKYSAVTPVFYKLSGFHSDWLVLLMSSSSCQSPWKITRAPL